MSIKGTIKRAAYTIDGKAVLLPSRWDRALVGYTIPEGTRLAVGVYDVAGHSVATAEIAPNGKIVQFYADEDREEVEQMKPTAEAQIVVDKWLKDFGKDAVKAMKKVA